jgi:hypothetical protein
MRRNSNHLKHLNDHFQFGIYPCLDCWLVVSPYCLDVARRVKFIVTSFISVFSVFSQEKTENKNYSKMSNLSEKKEQEITISPNKERYLIESDYSDALAGLNFFALKNSRGSFVIPSTKNFVQSFQIKKMKCDDGATATILPIASLLMLSNLFQDYRHICRFVISEFRTVGGPTLGLTIFQANSKPIFEFRIGLDIFPFAKKVSKNLHSKFEAVATKSFATATPEVPIDATNSADYEYYKKVSCLNFFLCSEDIDYLLDPQNSDLMILFKNNENAKRLKRYEQVVLRRNSALLGSDFLRESGGGISFGKVKIYFNTDVHKLENCTWKMFSEIATSIFDMEYLTQGSVDFEVLDSIELNDIVGIEVQDEDEKMYSDEVKLIK